MIGLGISLNCHSLHSGQFKDQKSLDLHEKYLDLSNNEIFQHKILKSRTFKKSSILIVIIYFFSGSFSRIRIQDGSRHRVFMTNLFSVYIFILIKKPIKTTSKLEKPFAGNHLDLDQIRISGPNCIRIRDTV